MRSLRLITVLVSLLTVLLIMYVTPSTATTTPRPDLTTTTSRPDLTTTTSRQVPVATSEACATDTDYCAFLPLTRVPALPLTLQEVGILPSDLAAIEVSGSYAYATQYTSLYSIDVSNPAEPRVVGGLELPVEDPYAVTDIEVEPPFAYVSTYKEPAIHLIDISQPAQPRWLTAIDGIGGSDIEVVDQRVYAMNSSWDMSLPTFAIVDVVNGSTFELRGTFGSTGNSSLAIKDSIAYVPNFGNGLLMLDISIPDDPSVLGVVSLPDELYPMEHIELDGSYLYATMSDVLAVFDISEPKAPVLRSTYQLSGVAMELEVADGLAYIASHPTRLLIVDVHNPDQMELLMTHPILAGSLHDVELDGSLLYLGSSLDLYILRVTPQ